MSIFASSIAFNPLTQRILAQSSNLGYAGRGAYRVSDTQPSRKGDYWFRDFGMVMACTYMTELGFRGTERLYTMPLLTDAMQLNALSSQKRNYPRLQTLTTNVDPLQQLTAQGRYPRALNYTMMPDRLRQKMMGTVIHNSSELVGEVLREEQLDQWQKVHPDSHFNNLKTLLTNPQQAGNERILAKHLFENGLSPINEDLFVLARNILPHNLEQEARLKDMRALAARHNLPVAKLRETLDLINDLTRVAQIDNLAQRESELQKLRATHPLLKARPEQVTEQTIDLIRAEQMGYLTDHLDRTLNPALYLQRNFFKAKGPELDHGFEMPAALRRKNQHHPLSELGELLSGRMKHYVDTLDTLQNGAKGEIYKIADTIRKLPMEKRAEYYAGKMPGVEAKQYLYKKESLTDFWHAPDNESKQQLQAVYETLRKHDNFKHELKGNPNAQKIWQAFEAKEKESITCLHNWEREFSQKKAGLEQFLLENEKISPKELAKHLQHFDGYFEQLSQRPAVKQEMLNKMWYQLGADLMLQIKKEVKNAVEALDKIPHDCLPETHASRLARQQGSSRAIVRATKEEVLTARLKDLGLLEWKNVTEDRLKTMSKDLLGFMAKSRSLEHHFNEPRRDLVNKTVWMYLTGSDGLDKSKPGNLAPSWKSHTGEDAPTMLARLKRAFTGNPDDFKAPSIRGSLYELLTNQQCVGAKTDPHFVGGGLENLLKPLIQTDRLHTVINEADKPVKSAEWTFKSLIYDGLQSKRLMKQVASIQKNGTWPKMAATVALNFIFYGWLASRFDNKVLQPYQEKLVARKGTSQDIVTAGYIGVLPGLLWLSQLHNKVSAPVFQRMNHFSRFSVVGAGALATFAAATYGTLKVLEKRPPAKPVTPPGAPASVPPMRPSLKDNLAQATGFAARPNLTAPFQGFDPYGSVGQALATARNFRQN